MNAAARFSLAWAGEPDLIFVDADVMLSDNDSDPALCAWLQSAKPGESMQVGGGASPACVVRRVS